MKIVFIAGAGRSGTTLLDIVLGQAKGFFSVGELAYVWERSFKEDQLCGCGAKFSECAFWEQVVEKAFGGKPDLAEIKTLTNTISQNRYVPQLMALSKTQSQSLKEYGQILRSFYQAISDISGSEFIIDSSKEPFQAPLLASMGKDVELHIVHLIRDPRAVAWSWQRKKVRKEIHWKVQEMDTYSPLRISLHWNKRLLQVEVLRGLGKYHTVFYEDLVNNPQAEIGRLLRDLGSSSSPDFIEGNTVNLSENHTVSGNPMRFQKGQLKIKADNEWKTAMPKHQQALVTALTFPQLTRLRALR